MPNDFAVNPVHSVRARPDDAPNTLASLTSSGVSGDLTGKITSGESMGVAATTTLSSKGQVVIPEQIRERLGLKAGAQFVVLAERDVVIFKVLDPPTLSEFAPLVAKAR